MSLANTERELVRLATDLGRQAVEIADLANRIAKAKRLGKTELPVD